VVLAAADELALGRLSTDAVSAGFRTARFFEPDLGGSLTAIALEPAADRLTKRLPLAFTRTYRGEVKS
jgi:hypothetical protein